MNLETFAREELKKAGLFKKSSDYGGMLAHATMKLIRVFSKEGHSGFSANMAIQIFEKLARYEPLTPLTGEDDEWNEVGTGVFQNKRCSHVFKENDKAYDQQGIIFRDRDGRTYTSRHSRVNISFPYIPKSQILPDWSDIP